MDDNEKKDSKTNTWLPVGELAERILRQLSQDGVVDRAMLEAAIAAATEAGHTPFPHQPRIKAAAIRYPVEPRDIPPEKAARRLHLTMEEFVAYADSLYARGFPRPDPTTGMYDLKAIDAWMDKRSNLTPAGQPLTAEKPARNAGEVIGDRARQMLHG